MSWNTCGSLNESTYSQRIIPTTKKEQTNKQTNKQRTTTNNIYESKKDTLQVPGNTLSPVSYVFALILLLSQLISIMLLDLSQQYFGTQGLLRLLEKEQLIVEGLVVVGCSFSPRLQQKKEEKKVGLYVCLSPLSQISTSSLCYLISLLL